MRIDMINSIPDAPVLDRREFFVTSIFAAGTFGLAVQTLQAQTIIKTDDKGLDRRRGKDPCCRRRDTGIPGDA